MKSPELASLLKVWRGIVVAVESPERVEARRAEAIPRIAAAIRASGSSRRRRRRLGFAAMALAASVVLALGFAWSSGFRNPRPEAAVAQLLTGYVVAGDARVAVGSELPLRQRLTTRAPAKVDLGRVTSLDIASDSELWINRLDSGEQRVRLVHGRLRAEVTRGKLGAGVRLETPHAEVVVTGTRFAVTVLPDAGGMVTSVAVNRGSVKVRRRGGGMVELGAGQSWRSRSSKPASVPASVAGVPKLSEADLTPEPQRRRATRAPRVTAQVVERPLAEGTLGEENALFHRAVKARNSGENALAVQVLTTLLTRYPRSPLAQEAKVERLRALSRLGRHQEAAESARRYLAEHPGGFAQSEARELALKRRQQDASSKP